MVFEFGSVNEPFISRESILNEIADLESQLIPVPIPIFETRCKTLGFPESRSFCDEEQTNVAEIKVITDFNNNINSQIAQKNLFLNTLQAPSELLGGQQNNTLRNALIIGGILLVL